MAPQSLFYGRGGVHLKINCCRVIGVGSNLNPSGYQRVWLKRVESGKRLGLISSETSLFTTWLGWTHLTWLGWMNLMSCSTRFMRHSAQWGSGNQQFHPSIFFSGQSFGSKSQFDCFSSSISSCQLSSWKQSKHTWSSQRNVNTPTILSIWVFTALWVAGL